MSKQTLTPEITERRRIRYIRESNLTYQCASCGQVKRVSEFYFDKTRSIGHSHSCKECEKSKRREYLANNPDAYEQRQKTSQAYREKLRRKEARRRKTPQGKQREAVNKAIHGAVVCGALVKPDVCSMCGRTAQLHAHHVRGWATLDALFDIRWVCQRCHIEIHHGKPDD